MRFVRLNCTYFESSQQCLSVPKPLQNPNDLYTPPPRPTHSPSGILIVCFNCFNSGRQLEAAMLRIDKDTIAICKDEWSLLLGEDGKPHQTGRVGDSAEKVEETRCNIKLVYSLSNI